MTLRGHGGDEEVTNKGQEEWGSVSQIKISKGGGAGELQEPQLGLCFMGGWGSARVSAIIKDGGPKVRASGGH